MQNRRQIGTKEEALAAAFLEKQGYQILERNFRCRLGEIDLIARDGSTLVFVEVKYRKNADFGTPAEAVNRKKQLTICETAIARLEADSARLEAEMAENACDAEKLNALYQEQQDVQKRLEQEMERWEELSLQAEEQEER